MLPFLVALAAVTGRANILLLLTDDQDALLGSMEAMPFTHKVRCRDGERAWCARPYQVSPQCH